jgi:hypothetical protein
MILIDIHGMQLDLSVNQGVKRVASMRIENSWVDATTDDVFV